MDLKDPKMQKIGLGVLAFFIVAYFWYSRLYTKLDTEIANKSQQFESITTNLRNVELKAKSLDALKLEYADLTDRYTEIESLLPEVKQIPSLLVQLHTASSLTGTRVTKIEPLDIVSEEFYNIASFNVEMTGTYHDFGRFISYVANFPFIANVTQTEVKASKLFISEADANDMQDVRRRNMGKEETITASFKLSTYYVQESERLKDLVL